MVDIHHKISNYFYSVKNKNELNFFTNDIKDVTSAEKHTLTKVIKQLYTSRQNSHMHPFAQPS